MKVGRYNVKYGVLEIELSMCFVLLILPVVLAGESVDTFANLSRDKASLRELCFNNTITNSSTLNSGCVSLEVSTLMMSQVYTSLESTLLSTYGTSAYDDSNSLTPPLTTNINPPNESNAEAELRIEDSTKPIGLDENSSNTDLWNNTRFETSSNLTETNNLSIDESYFLSFEEWKNLKLMEQKESNLSASSLSGLKASAASKKAKLSSIAVDIETEEDRGKLYKDRINYASLDCAATVVKTNADTKGASAILFENKDKYLLNKCSLPQKFIVIELCEDILVDTIVMGNFEFFSSTFKNVRFSVSDRFPATSPTSWKCLGEFIAENIRDVQSFKIVNPLIWARYLKVEILSHYGDEFYCPISLVRVYGKTMIEEYKMAAEEDALVEDQLLKHNFTDEVHSLSKESREEDREECAVALPLLGLEQFLDGNYAADHEYCDAYLPTLDDPGIIEASEPSTTQESIYKNIMKRIFLLESNATLSLLYIEEQSRLLSAAFANIERRQSLKIGSVLQNLNETVHANLHHLITGLADLQSEASNLIENQKLMNAQLYSDFVRSLEDQVKIYRGITIFNFIIIITVIAYACYRKYVSFIRIEGQVGVLNDQSNASSISCSRRKGHKSKQKHRRNMRGRK